MKKFSTVLFIFILTLTFSASAFAQPADRDFYYWDDGVGPTEPPLRTLCNNLGIPIPDGEAQVCIYWDRNANGPDPTDLQPDTDPIFCENCVNYSCFPINGELVELGEGYFATEQTMTLYTVPDTNFYYMRINVNIGGEQSCWTSTVFQMTTGIDEIFFQASDWTCAPGLCQVAGEPPAAPTNVVASDDSLCVSISITWEHTGQNVTGFIIYDQNGVIGTANPNARYAVLQVNDPAVRSIYVRATNAVGMSEPSNADAGSTYLLRFAAGETGDLQGDNMAGAQFAISMEQPEDVNHCPARQTLYMINRQNQITDTLCVDSMVTVMTCTLPQRVDTIGYRLLLRAQSISQLSVFTDTTASYFRLGAVSADDRTRVIPAQFSLAQNYPNPFNPTTNISFDVPALADVKIEVFNIHGQLVTTLVNGTVGAGQHVVEWNGMSDHGVAVTSGLYLYRMSGPGFVQTKKMLLMK